MKKVRSKSGKYKFIRVIGEVPYDSKDFVSPNSDPAHRFARRRKRFSTAAERKFEQIISEIDEGFFAEKFEREWAICGKWILDFYFPKYRLAVEIDGSFHNSAEQIEKDAKKAADCEKLEITLLRFSNREIFTDQEKLIEKFKEKLVVANLRAENCTRKKTVEPAKKSETNEKITIRLTKREQNLIREHFEFYKSLANGKRQPTTAAQKHFVAVCLGNIAPESEHEIAFAKFIKIQSAQLKK